MIIKPLIWDSDFFKINVGELYFNQSDDKEVINCSDFDLLYVKSITETPVHLFGFENTFVENKLTFSKTKIGLKKYYNKSIKSVHDVDIDIRQLYDLAFESG